MCYLVLTIVLAKQSVEVCPFMFLVVPSTLTHDSSAASVSFTMGLHSSDLFVSPDIYLSKIDSYLADRHLLGNDYKLN